MEYPQENPIELFGEPKLKGKKLHFPGIDPNLSRSAVERLVRSAIEALHIKKGKMKIFKHQKPSTIRPIFGPTFWSHFLVPLFAAIS